jgi:type I site-specific restriction endonuclease
VQKLKLPSFTFRIEERNGHRLIFDENRRRWVVLTPEEWVRQHFIRYLKEEKKFPRPMMAVEKKVIINGLSQRFDLLVYDRKGNPLMIGEFKSPDVPVGQMTFDQASRYNSVLKAPYLLVSNGMTHFAGKYDFEAGSFSYLNEIPSFEEMTALVT